MNYLWEVLLQAKKQGIGKNRLQFTLPERFSPYQELSREYLNVTRLEEPCQIEINPYYRFLSVFKWINHPDLEEFYDIRKGLFQLLIHQLGENDIKMGMTREEYLKKILCMDLEEGIYGKEKKEEFALFIKKEKEILLGGILNLYRTGDSLTLFKRIFCTLFKSCIVYENQDEVFLLMIYIGQKESEILRKKVNFLLDFFLGIQYRTEIYYEYHFGIIDVEETMCIDEITIC